MRFCDILVRITILQFLEVCSIYYIDLFYLILFDKMLYDKPFAFNSVHHMFLCLQNNLQLCYLFLVIYWITYIMLCDINVYCIIFLSCDCKCNCMCIVQFYAVSYRKLYIVLFCFMFKNMLFWRCIIVSKENSWRKLRVTEGFVLTCPKIIVSSWHVP